MQGEIDGERDGEGKGVIDTIVEMKKERKEKKYVVGTVYRSEAPSTSRGLSSTLPAAVKGLRSGKVSCGWLGQ